MKNVYITFRFIEISYNGNINVKRDGAVQQYTQHEMDEYIKCGKDPTYFAINYCKLLLF